MPTINRKKYNWIFLLTVVAAINMILSFFPFKADLTDDNRYSLSPATQTLLRSLKEPVRIDILLTGEFPASFKKLQTSTKELLDQMKQYAGSGFQIHFTPVSELFPESQQEKVWLTFSDSLRRIGIPVDSLLSEKPGLIASFKQQYLADTLKRLGIMPYTLQVQQDENETSQRTIYPAAILSSGGKILSVDLLSGKTEYTRDPLTGSLVNDEARSIGNAEALLEYKIASAIEKIQQKQRPAIGYLTGNGQPMGPETQKLVETVTTDHPFGLIDLQKNEFIPKEVAVLLIVKPTIPFTDSAKRKLDQYVMQGGKILWFIDQLYAEKDSLLLNAKTIAYDRGLNLDDLLFRYGIRINRDLMQDLQCDISKLVVGVSGGQPQLADIPFNYYPLLSPSSFHPATRNLEPVLGLFVNTMDTVKSSGIKKTVLLASSPTAKTISTPASISLEELKTIQRPELYTKKNIPAAILLEGPFNSLYANRTDQISQKNFKNYYGSFRTTAPTESAQLIVSDGDLILNEYTRTEALPMGYSRSRETSFANKQFLENLLQYMTGLKEIVALRNREVTVRLLDKAKLAEQKQMWQILNVLVPLLLLLIGGVIFDQWRKKAYRTP